MAEIKLPVGALPRGSEPVSKYYTKEYSDEILQLAQKFAANGYRPMFIATDTSGIRPNSLRVAIYTGRRYIREHESEFPPGARDLVETLSIECRERPIVGIYIRRAIRTTKLAEAAMQTTSSDGDNERYQQLMAWVGEERELDDMLEFDGPFGLSDYERYKRTAEQLRGIFLSEITPLKIKFIYHPGGR